VGRVTESVTSLLEKSVHDLLFLAHKFFMFFQAVRLTLDVDNGAVMQYLIQDGGGNGNVGKDLVPLGEGLVSGKSTRILYTLRSASELFGSSGITFLTIFSTVPTNT
jgi:hypothetical protein